MILEFPEFAPDSADYGSAGVSGATSDVSQPLLVNVAPSKRGWSTIPFWTNPTNYAGGVTAATAIAGAYSSRYGSTTIDVAGDTSKLYIATNNANGYGPADWSKGGGYALPAGNYWDFAQFGEYVIGVNGGTSAADTPQVFGLVQTTTTNSVSWTAFADLAGTPPKAKTITTVGDFVVVGNTYDATDGVKPGRVRWCGFGDHTSWAVSAATLADLQDLKSEVGAVERVLGGNEAFIVCTGGVVVMRRAELPYIFDFQYVHPGVGTNHGHSCVRVGGSCYFWSTSGFVRVGLQAGDVQYIGAGRVDRAFALRSASESRQAVGVHDPQNQSIRWQVGSQDMQYCYSYAYDKWWTAQAQTNLAYPYTSDIASSAYAAGSAVYGYGDIELLYGHINLTRTEIATLSTGFVQLAEGRRTLLRRVRPIYEHSSSAGTPTLDVYAYNDPVRQSSFSSLSPTTYSLNSVDGCFDTLIDARFHQLVFKTTGSGPTHHRMQIVGLDIDGATPAGRY